MSGTAPSAGKRQPANALSPARACAAKALRLVQEQGASASSAIRSQVESCPLSPEDARFASALVLGVVQTQGVLDEVLDGILDKPRGVRPDVRRALQIAAYELLFLGKEPQYAVDQGVRLAGKSAPFAKAMANAVLRRVAEHREALFSGDPDEDFSAFCFQAGFPESLARLLCADRGEVRTRHLIRLSNERPPVFVHVNALKSAADEVLGSLARAGIQTERIHDVPGCARLARSADVASDEVAALVREGKLIVSDLAAQSVAFACVRDHLPESLLEVGAGTGTKALLIQSMARSLHGRQVPRHVCVDNVAFKRDELLKRVQLCGAHLTDALVADGRCLDEVLSPSAFEEVLVDAPCSGLGTLRRHPEIRWRVSEDDIKALASLQQELLASAAGSVAACGRLIYSTCSVTQAENEEVASSFLSSKAGSAFRWEAGFSTVDAGFGADSHFCCIMQRSS